jgi:hypothetical protein
MALWRGYVHIAGKAADFGTVHIRDFSLCRKAFSQADMYHMPLLLCQNCSALLND